MKSAARIATTAALVGVGLLGLLHSSGALDETPPSLTVEADTQAPLTGTLTAMLSVADDAPGVGGWSASLDGTPTAVAVGEDGRLSVSLAGLPDGAHTLEVAAWDSAWTPNWSHTTVSFTVDQTPPTLRIATRSLEAAQGRVLPVLLEGSEAMVPSGTLGDDPLSFYALDETQTRWRALVGVATEAEPGPLPLALRCEDQAGNAVSASQDVTVLPTLFSEGGTLRLRPDQVAARRDEGAKAKMREERDAAYAWNQGEQLWTGVFELPVSGGRLSSAFGRSRTYPDGSKSHHTGTDIAAPTGTPVVAAAAGEVRFVGEQAIFGKVVIVHHGQGLATTYNQLSEISVEPGERLAQGDPLGAVGSTGQSTGPHLHWGVVANGTVVDGMHLLDEDLDPSAEEPWTALDADVVPR